MDNLQPNDAVGLSYIPQLKTDSTTDVVIYETGNATRGAAAVPGVAPAETEFDRQKRLFLSISLTEREQYNGSYVASYNGVIVDHDVDLPSLTNRFFSHYGDVDVYITKVGERQRVLLRTPHLR